VTRRLLAGLGVLVAAYGGWLLVSRQDLDRVVAAAEWLVAGVVLHDAVLAPVVLGTWVLLARLAPRSWRAPAAVGLVVLGPVTLLAVPVLGRFGARDDNPTLLDRPYLAGWLLLAGLVVLAVAAAGLVRSRHAGAELRASPARREE
jgi:hypothetical protein